MLKISELCSSNTNLRSDIIIFGCSPFINEIRGDIPSILEKFQTIGINRFPCYYPNVNHWFFYDFEMINVLRENYNNQLIHCPQEIKGHLDILKIKNFEIFSISPCLELEKNNHLWFCNNTVTSAINWCIKQGFKNVYLAGVDLDSEDFFHFYNTNYAQFTHRSILKPAVKAIYAMQEYINIYQLNPNNTLDLPKKNIKDLLCQI